MASGESLPLIEVKDRAEWRAWLMEHHNSPTGIWLAIGKKGGSVTSLTYDDAVEEALCFGWIDSTVHAMDADRYRQLYTPRRKGSIWSAPNKERVRRLEEAGLMTDAGREAIARAKADGSWDALTNVEALVMPDDLTQALTADQSAERGWDSLPANVRKQLLWWIVSAKRPTTRASRIAETVAAAAEGRAPR